MLLSHIYTKRLFYRFFGIYPTSLAGIFTVKKGASLDSKSLSGKTILFVDDEPLIREILCFEYQRYGAKTLEASNAKEALDFLKSEKIDLVFTDVRMPGGDGIELINSIHSQLNYRPLIYVFSGFTHEAPEKIKGLGVDKYFNKPVDFKNIENEIFTDLVKNSTVA